MTDEANDREAARAWREHYPKLSAELQRLRGKCDTEHAAREKAETALASERESRLRAERERDEARAALRKHGEHRPECYSLVYADETNDVTGFDCNCGFAAALSSPAVTTGGLGKGKVEARCDWFGHDGEGAQCGERARFLVGSRHLCAEHSTVVRRSIHHPEGA